MRQPPSPQFAPSACSAYGTSRACWPACHTRGCCTDPRCLEHGFEARDDRIVIELNVHRLLSLLSRDGLPLIEAVGAPAAGVVGAIAAENGHAATAVRPHTGSRRRWHRGWHAPRPAAADPPTAHRTGA